MLDTLKPYSKAIVAFFVAVVAGAIAQGLIVGQSALWFNVIIGALATAGVYQPATPRPPPRTVPPRIPDSCHRVLSA